MEENGKTGKTVGLFVNWEKDKSFALTKEITKFLLGLGCRVLLSLEVSQAIGMPEMGADLARLFSEPDFLIVLGGDGTILSTARETARFDTPILGINMGTLGYLSDAETTDYQSSILHVLSGEYDVENRMMLCGRVHNQDGTGPELTALNDLCITRGEVSKIVDLHVYANYEYLDTFRGDGLIIATPTGSTAYNLSAGGPILKPDTQSMAITPICPHSLYARSIVISAADFVTVEIGSRSRGELVLSVDGQDGIPLRREDVVRIGRSAYTTQIIKTNPVGFYDRLRRKLADH